jgi:hypothetical protein
MRTDMLMNNADSDTIRAFKRARAVKAATASMLVFWLAAIALTPVESSYDISTTPAAVQPAHESSGSESSFGRGSSIDDSVTGGVDMHG